MSRNMSSVSTCYGVPKRHTDKFTLFDKVSLLLFETMHKTISLETSVNRFWCKKATAYLQLLHGENSHFVKLKRKQCHHIGWICVHVFACVLMNPLLCLIQAKVSISWKCEVMRSTEWLSEESIVGFEHLNRITCQWHQWGNDFMPPACLFLATLVRFMLMVLMVKGSAQH